LLFRLFIFLIEIIKSEKKHKISTVDEEEKAELRSKKMKTGLTLEKSDFSSW
jgi:hypothetical protein